MRSVRSSLGWGGVVSMLVPVLALAQANTASPNRITVPLSAPTKPATLRVSLIAGSIVVTGYEGKEVLIDPRLLDEGESVDASDQEREEARREAERERQEAQREREQERKEREKERKHGSHITSSDDDSYSGDRTRGLRKVPNLSSGLSVEEDENVVTINGPFQDRTVDLDIKVPTQSSLVLQTVNDGDIIIRNVRGEIEAENTNGRVTLTKVSGPVVAHALNGDVVATLVALDATKPSSFSSMNGDIDVTLPPDAKADVHVRSDNGEIYTDFDLKLESRTTPTDDQPGKRGKKRWGYETGMFGTLNGGGPTLRFQTYNGSVYIRKAK